MHTITCLALLAATPALTVRSVTFPAGTEPSWAYSRDGKTRRIANVRLGADATLCGLPFAKGVWIDLADDAPMHEGPADDPQRFHLALPYSAPYAHPLEHGAFFLRGPIARDVELRGVTLKAGGTTAVRCDAPPGDDGLRMGTLAFEMKLGTTRLPAGTTVAWYPPAQGGALAAVFLHTGGVVEGIAFPPLAKLGFDPRGRLREAQGSNHGTFVVAGTACVLGPSWEAATFDGQGALIDCKRPDAPAPLTCSEAPAGWVRNGLPAVIREVVPRACARLPAGMPPFDLYLSIGPDGALGSVPVSPAAAPAAREIITAVSEWLRTKPGPLGRPREWTRAPPSTVIDFATIGCVTIQVRVSGA